MEEMERALTGTKGRFFLHPKGLPTGSEDLWRCFARYRTGFASCGMSVKRVVLLGWMAFLAVFCATGHAALPPYSFIDFEAGTGWKIGPFPGDRPDSRLIQGKASIISVPEQDSQQALQLGPSKPFPALFIDASAEFEHIGNKNKLLPEHQKKLLDAFIARKNDDHFAKLIPNAEIAGKSYVISVSSYVDKEDSTEAIDIATLNAEIARIVARQSERRADIDAIVANLEGTS